jgi:hypothetical protein
MCVQSVQNTKRYHYRFPTNRVISPYPTDQLTKPIETTRELPRSLGQIEKKSPYHKYQKLSLMLLCRFRYATCVQTFGKQRLLTDTHKTRF